LNSLPTIELYRTIIESIREGVCIIDQNQIIRLTNNKLSEIIGYSREELTGKLVYDFMDANKIAEADSGIERRKKGLSEQSEYLLSTKYGDQKWVTLNSIPLFYKEEYIGVLTTIIDISEEKRNALILKENFSQYASLFEDSPIPIWDEDFSEIKKEIDLLKASGVKSLKKYFLKNPHELERISEKLIVRNINQAVVEINEAKNKEEVLTNFKYLVTEESIKYALIQLEAIANGKTSCEFDAELKTLQGNKRFVHLKWSVVKGFENDYSRVYLTTTDLTERIKEENLALQRSNREKAMLLKEVHHRVKNNLQIISSLLKLQSNTIDNQDVQAIFEVSLNRIYSMAKVHELLYKSTEFSEINYKEYVETLINSLISTMIHNSQEIQVDIKVDDIKININTAIPLGLIINEILTNSFKHGLNNGLAGMIYVHIIKLNEDHFLLSIGDNGKGFKDIPVNQEDETLGLSLIESLTEQLSGTLKKLDLSDGTHYELEFSMVK
jgi:PAS domain S-box-containing protein